MKSNELIETQMKKAVLVLVLGVITLSFVSCEKNELVNEDQAELQLIEPSEDGSIDDSDMEEY